jgi:segregation and condensation protein B
VEEQEFMRVVEALLFVSGDPIELATVSEITEIKKIVASKWLDKLIDRYSFEQRGLQIIKAGTSYQFATRPEHRSYINLLTGDGEKEKLSQSVIETLSIIAYKQPVTRVDIENIRGVRSGYAMSVLLEKCLIDEAGRLEAPGRPKLYRTTNDFLRTFGLEKIEDLPPIETDDEVALVIGT